MNDTSKWMRTYFFILLMSNLVPLDQTGGFGSDLRVFPLAASLPLNGLACSSRPWSECTLSKTSGINLVT
jgi:hypothetical protein